MHRITLPLLWLSLALSASTSDQLYATGRNAQRGQCQKQPDAATRERCLKDADTPHDAYQKEANPERR